MATHRRYILWVDDVGAETNTSKKGRFVKFGGRKNDPSRRQPHFNVAVVKKCDLSDATNVSRE